ncbi:hypothetical protein MHYP_G00009970 [Metynnis hypsauchen]
MDTHEKPRATHSGRARETNPEDSRRTRTRERSAIWWEDTETMRGDLGSVACKTAEALNCWAKPCSLMFLVSVEGVQLLVEMSACRPQVFDAGDQFQKAKSEDYLLRLQRLTEPFCALAVWGTCVPSFNLDFTLFQQVKTEVYTENELMIM